jgi:methyl-accepting chemotaxis protein
MDKDQLFEAISEEIREIRQLTLETQKLAKAAEQTARAAEQTAKAAHLEAKASWELVTMYKLQQDKPWWKKLFGK